MNWPKKLRDEGYPQKPEGTYMGEGDRRSPETGPDMVYLPTFGELFEACKERLEKIEVVRPAGGNVNPIAFLIKEAGISKEAFEKTFDDAEEGLAEFWLYLKDNENKEY